MVIGVLVIGVVLGYYIGETIGIWPDLPPDRDLATWAAITLALGGVVALDSSSWGAVIAGLGGMSALTLSARRAREEHEATQSSAHAH